MFIWFLVLPETGPWTCVALTFMTIQIELDNLVPSDWSKT